MTTVGRTDLHAHRPTSNTEPCFENQSKVQEEKGVFKQTCFAFFIKSWFYYATARNLAFRLKVQTAEADTPLLSLMSGSGERCERLFSAVVICLILQCVLTTARLFPDSWIIH